MKGLFLIYYLLIQQITEVDKMDGWINGWVDGWIDAWIHGYMDLTEQSGFLFLNN